MKTVVVGISDMKISNNLNETLITYSLGSCLGLLVYDYIAHVAGILHCMLPLSKIDLQKAKVSPFMFVDTGVPLLFKDAYRLGAEKSHIRVFAVGCSSLLDEKGFFRIGERNYAILRKLLWKNNILIDKQDIGGTDSRTVSIEVGTGKVLVSSKGQENVL